MEKIDFKKTLDSYQAQAGAYRILKVPKLHYLMIDGHGDPNTAPEFTAALEVLYPVAYKLKFMSKATLNKDYVVPPLEGLWWSADMESFTVSRDKSQWDWTMMIMTPDWISKDMFAVAQEVAMKKNPACGHVRFEALTEGLCVQSLHIGSYDKEGPVLEKMHHEFIPSNGLHMVKKHHEIYFSDFRKTSADKLRTILRQPVEAKT